MDARPIGRNVRAASVRIYFSAMPNRRVATAATAAAVAALVASLSLPACRAESSRRGADVTVDTIADASEAAAAVADPAGPVEHGAPRGYVAFSESEQRIENAQYTPLTRGGWEVRTGPSHFVYAPGDTASGSYTVAASFEPLEQSRLDFAAFAIFVGGHAAPDGDPRPLMLFSVNASRERTRFSVRHMIEGGREPERLADWKTRPDLPPLDAAERGSYRLAVTVGRDSMWFRINGTTVFATTTAGRPTSGLAGFRIGRDLHLVVHPLAIERGR